MTSNSKTVSVRLMNAPKSWSLVIAPIRRGRSARKVLKAGMGGKPRTKRLTQIFMLNIKRADWSLESCCSKSKFISIISFDDDDD